MVLRIRYGRARSQVADLYLPQRPAADPCPVVVVVHGGFWYVRYGMALMDAHAADLASRGLAAWNIEYRRVGERGGGWPGTFDDVAAAVDALADLAPKHRLDLDRVSAVGHSAGGQLALWLAGRVDARVRVRAVVAHAGVADLRQGHELGLGGGACTALLGGSPARHADRYAEASPVDRLPLGIPQLLVHGEADRHVPLSQSRAYAAAALAAGDPVELIELPGVGHFEVLDPRHESWVAGAEWLARTCGVRPAEG